LFSHDGYLNALAPARRDHIDLTLPAVYNLKKKNGELIGTETRHFLSDISFGGNLKKYWKQYQWSNIFAMLRNQKLSPKICTDDFNGRLVVITGATSGIGYATAKKYASHGADILSINRNEEKSKRVCETLSSQYDTNCTYLIADFANLTDVHDVAKKLSALDRTIDVFIHNAGVFATKKTFTVDNLEMAFQVNYLSTFILNYRLREKFIKQKSGRILFVNSEAHRFAVWGLNLDDLAWEEHRYSGLKSYGAAKTAQLLSMIKLSAYFAGTGVTVNAMHPGNVKTSSGKNNGAIYQFFKRILVDRTAKSPEVSAEALYYLGVSSALDNTSGKFFNLTTEEEPAPPALDKEAAEELWALSLTLGGIK
jgi:NAD(P)-dependent dehydrogenase (short-subunit alcohol dehydrogenase family)